MQDNKSDKVFKILAVDGGGIKGLYSAALLNEFEKKYGNLTDYFDLLCGTSTGGLITLALASGQSTDNIIDFYVNSGPKIFKKVFLCKFCNNVPVLKNYCLKQILVKSKYSNKYLKQELQKIFENKQIKDSNSYLCVPTLDFATGNPWVFKTSHTKELVRDFKTLMRNVALCTSSAPTYFPIAVIEEFPCARFTDGGLWGNNPALIGMIEAFNYFVGKDKKYNSMSILSISSGSVNTTKSIDNKLEKSYRSWGFGQNIIQLILEAQGVSTNLQLELLSRAIGVNYIRIPGPELSKDQQQIIDIDKTDKKALELLECYGRSTGYNWVNKPEIASLFSEKKDSPVFYNEEEE